MGSWLSISVLRAHARRNRGECLSDPPVTEQASIRWRCQHGHTWKAPPSIVLERRWCPDCPPQPTRTNGRHSLAQMLKIAQSRGGRCLSNEYQNPRTKLRWRCHLGHEWKASGDAVAREGHWCPTCGKTPHTLARLRALAESRGGACLAEDYAGVNLRLRWRCANGHSWSATPHAIVSKSSWCPVCAVNAQRIQRAYRGAARRHGVTAQAS